MVRFPAEATEFFVIQSVDTDFCGYPLDTGGFVPGDNVTGS